MMTHTGSGALAPARVYRWEALPGMADEQRHTALRTDDDSPVADAWVAAYWLSDDGEEWLWVTPDHGAWGEEQTEAAARRACLLAVLHAPAADERGEQGGTVR